MPATSFFTYSVTRQYPAKFTWLILAGGSVLITFLTFVAVAGNAYELVPRYTNDYNATVASEVWYQRQAFSWATDMVTTCQPALLTIGNDRMTSNRGFHYAIESFRHVENTSNVTLTASYRDGPLSDCQVVEIVIELVRSNQARLPKNHWTWGSTVARSTTQCTIDTDDDLLKVNLTAMLPPASKYGEISDNFLALNDSVHPGRYIGAQLLSKWYTHVVWAMAHSVPWSQDLIDPDGPSWASGQITLTRNEVMDFESLDFFTCDVEFQYNGPDLSFMHPEPDQKTIRNWKDEWATGGDPNFNLPNISIAVDAFAKTYYSLLLSDFSASKETESTNALSTGQGLNYLHRVNDTDLADAMAKFGDAKGAQGTISSLFDPDSTNLTQPLNITQGTTVSSQYLCSIPRPKSTFKLLFAVAVADLVLLRACWTVFGWIATWWLARKHADVEHCIGCINASHDIPLGPAPGSGGGGSYSRVSSEAEEEHRGHEGRI